MSIDPFFVYRLISRLPVSVRYETKIIGIAAFASVLPLTLLIAYNLTNGQPLSEEMITVLTLALLSTALGIILAIFGIRHLLRPLSLTVESIRTYRDKGLLPDLPTRYRDEAGQLMAGVRALIGDLDQRTRQFRHLTETDLTTGAGSRQWLMSRLRQELARARRHELPTAILLMDIDGLKEINTREGYEAGDNVIRLVAARIRPILRASDAMARVQGEVFAILLPDTDIQGAEHLASRIMHTVQTGDYGIDESVSVTIGITGIDASDIATHEVLQRANEALGTAKSRGRGNVFAVGACPPETALSA